MLLSKKLKWIFLITFSFLLVLVGFFSFERLSAIPVSSSQAFEWHNSTSENTVQEKKYIKWFEFKVSYEVLDKTSKLDIQSHNNHEDVKLNWIELISYLACKYGNDFSRYKSQHLTNLVEKLRSGQTMADLTKDMKNYNYYFEGYDSVLHEFIGDFKQEVKTTVNSKTNTEGTSSLDNSTVEQEIPQKQFKNKYGIKAFHPVAKNYSYSHYDDFGASRSYGYKRLHFGNDLMGSVGAPIIAVESGVVEAVGWNQYGGWRIGIRSFDKKRYYYYAHLRKNHPYAENLKEGQIVQAGDVIGYLGMTGYSTKENVNNINVPHLHFGIQLIFDEVQKEGPNQIWVDLYHLVNFLQKNRSEVYKSNQETKDYSRKYEIIDPIVP